MPTPPVTITAPVEIDVDAVALVVVIGFAVAIVPNPEAIEPAVSAPTVVMSVPVSFDAAIEPANIALVMLPVGTRYADIPIAGVITITAPQIAHRRNGSDFIMNKYHFYWIYQLVPLAA